MKIVKVALNIKKIIILTLLICCKFINPINAAETMSPIHVINNYFNDLNENQWEKASSWWVEENKNELLGFLANKENQKYKRGLLNIKKAKLIRWKELPYEYGQNYLPNRYMEKFENPRVFYVGVDYKVHSQNKYFIDGINYFIIAMVLEDGKWKMALTPHVPVGSIIFDGYGFGTEDEKTYDERRLKFLYKSTY